MSDTTQTRAYPVLPLPNGVVLPGMVITVALESAEARTAAQAAGGEGGELLLVPRVDDRYAAVAVVARIESTGHLPGGLEALVVRATARARVGAGVAGATTALYLNADPIDEGAPSARAQELEGELRAALTLLLDRVGGRVLAQTLRDADTPGSLADLVGWWPDLTIERRVELLETVDVETRVELVLGWVKTKLAELELTERISDEVRDGLDKQQREFLLRQQLQAIRSELGDEGDTEDALDEYRTRLDELRAADAPDDVVAAIDRELGRFERTSEQSPEHGWIRTWLDTAFGMPWTDRTDDLLDVAAARATLDDDHTGLDEVKERITEFLAVRKLRDDRGIGHDDDRAAGRSGRRTGAILALAGPPGVGKTSLGESVARALGRTFVRVALGGVRDEAEIRGHRRTYVGAQPGRIVRAIADAGSMNPVVLLDEIDKVGSDWRGDPSSALLEVLDPAQNHTFRDHYLEIDLDLSDVLFIATANVVENIPAPLLDRLELIRIDGYTEDEKVAIARDHLLGRQLAANGLRDGEVDLDDAVLARIVGGYTREPGVRELERRLGQALRKVAVRVAGGEPTPVAVTDDDLRALLGRERFQSEEIAERTGVPGVATGLAVTGAGGDVLFVEAAALPAGDAASSGSEPALTVTGQLGDVMQESAQIALTWVRSHAAELGVEPSSLGGRLHVHFPAGAVPKDGPSAGITMTTALVSLLTGRPVRADVAMTGEVTLSGRVLPIGGLKQKLLAAHRAGITHVVIPHRNEADLDDVPDAILEHLTVHPVADVHEVLALALEPAPALV
jgi:ATP-dependent Lon protease